MKNFKYNYLNKSTDFLTILDFLITVTQDTVFSTWQILEQQLQQVDPLREPDVYKALDDRANTLFSAWLQFRGRC